MVRVRLVDSPISSESEDMVEMIEVPDRMFADGEEPAGVRVLAYHRSSGIRSILRVLSDDEIQFIKDSTFGKFIDLADKPTFSGSFARYILSRQLKNSVFFTQRIMVRVRLVDSPISSESEDMVEMIEVPDRMFADGEEPAGVRVLAYHRSSGIRSILRVLSDDEIQFIKDSTFGKFIDLADKPTFSGFVHAMQLVMVEAVPALTEVVQEAGSSSSESDSDREDDDLHEKRNKGLTLSPGHARDVDHKCEVPAKCIIEDDSSHHVDNEYEDYSDEETDPKRGLTMADVERMGGKGKGKKKETKADKKAVSPETVSDSKLVTLLIRLKSRVGTLVENKIKSMIESMMVPMLKQKLFQMKGDIIQSIETMIKNQHQDPIINSKSQPLSVQDLNNSDPTSNDTENDSPTRGLSADISGLTPPPNVTSLENQMEHPPASKTVTTQSLQTRSLEEERQDHTNGRSSQEPETVEEDSQAKLPQRRKSLRLQNFLNPTLLPSTSVEQVIEIPSFSLGLSQEDNNDDLVNGSAAEQVAVEKDNPFDLQECRRGKRQKTVTHGLVDVFQCSPDILNRARESQMVVYGKADCWEYTQKYTKLAQKLKSHLCQVSNKDIIDIVERARPYSSKMKGDIIQSIETMIKNQHQDPIINSKSQPLSVQDLNNSDPTSNDTENVQPSENTYVQDEPQHFPEGDIHDSPTRGLSSDISGLTPSPSVTSIKNQMEHSPASKTMALRDPFPFIENPSFSLGLSQEKKPDHSDGRSSQEPETVEEDNQDKLPQRRKSLRLRNSLNLTLPPSTLVDQISEMESFPVIEILSFSLGLSQENNNDDLVNGLAAEQVTVEKDNPFDLQECRRGKRQKTVTHGLVDVFQCSPDILKRARESQMAVYGKADSWEYTQKYTKLAQKLKSHLNYSKFSKISAKETHMFVELFGGMVDHHPDHYIFYFPFNLDKKHWVDLCVDASSWIITVFDCNTSLRSEASMSSELKPISEMFPYLMKQAGLRISNSQLMPMVVERAKTVPKTIISADSSLTSVLLMQTHSLSGIETCRCIAPHILASEAQRVAVMLYEYHMKL
ncbi:hypothetical protein F2Q69_00041533 [Brassica cretica]|uniref:Ubiquitin-like protease family profile domain-containing protein n=1 Tax=Brassica cretica TaxID=69181 RepID=A0A8S9NH33_BRACR|nr:hypothetical protein F2Q69_00041533 [Brassica cretica]